MSQRIGGGQREVGAPRPGQHGSAPLVGKTLGTDLTGPSADPEAPSASLIGANGRPGTAGSRPMTIAELADAAGLHRIDVIAWRDFDDPEAGGSELHAHRIIAAWSDAGLDVSLTTSSVPGAPVEVLRNGCRVQRRSGRYAVFPRTMVSGALGRIGSGDGLVEIWNGMPFFSPLWAHCPSVVFLHHVHAEMWGMVLPPWMARIGYAVEHRLAPPVYRRSRLITLSESSKREIVERLHLSSDRIEVAPPGIDPQFSPGGERSPVPLVVAVGRLVPVKRFHLLIDALVELRRQIPDLRATIAGEGYERPALEARIRAAGAEEWISLRGYVPDDDLVELYRRAWVVAAASQREGWGMTVTEAGACGTPAVATRIGGHEDAVVDGRSGLLIDAPGELATALGKVLRDEVLRRRLGHGALEHSARFTWEATDVATLAVLAGEVGAAEQLKGSRPGPVWRSPLSTPTSAAGA
jgi:glycosyltransferase involved in cell wall biosynthesis